MFKIKTFRIWFIVTAAVLVFALAANIVFMGPLRAFMISTFGGERIVKTGATGDNTRYTADVDTKEEALAYANSVNEDICDEGFILLKNENNALPLATSATDKKAISVFGKNSVNLSYGGSGSSGGSSGGTEDIYTSLVAANYNCNPTLKSFYESTAQSGSGRAGNPAIENDGLAGFATGETPVANYTAAVTGSYADYDDMALVVFSRIGGEGFDLPTTMQKSFSNTEAVDGAWSAQDHYLELDKNEQDMLKHVCENFEKVVVIINSSTPLELGFLDATADGDTTQLDYDFASHIDAAIWIGQPGDTGILSLGRVLNGEVNPSGRTVDTYYRDFAADPTFCNFGCNGVANSDSYTVDGVKQNYYFIDYEEGIYIGYRYYETRGFTDGETWYNNAVVYPFGYGLSYTTFDWEVVSSTPSNSKIGKTTTISVTVRVKNTGTVAGKDVVELYVTSPYTNGEIEKAHKVLVGFAKTDVIQPQATCDVTITLSAYDLASYDYSDANHNDFKGYEVEAGSYVFSVSKNAHTVDETVTMTVDSDIKFDTDPVTEAEVVNRYEDADDQLQTLLSRTDWTGTWPTRRTAEQKETTATFISGFDSYDSGNPLTEESAEVVNANLEYQTKKLDAEVKLWQLVGKEYDDPLWDVLLSQLTISSMRELCETASYNTISIDYIDKPKTSDCDGPAGFTVFMGSSDVYDTCTYASECVVAATWSTELALAMGDALGNEALIGNERGDGSPYSGLYAPAVNTHRSPFSGRNFEYYSEDGVLAGKMAAQVVTGLKNKGVYTMVKHFVANDQETHRSITGLCTWLTEQSLREICMRPFEIAVKEGGTSGIMSSFNRLGTKWTGGDYRLLTEVLRNEWGFTGAVICDFATSGYMNKEQMAFAGGDLILSTVLGATWVDTDSALDIYTLKLCTKNALYIIANSNAMNGLGDGSSFRVVMPVWQVIMIVVDCVAFVGLGVWGFFVIRKSLKIRKEETEKTE